MAVSREERLERAMMQTVESFLDQMGSKLNELKLSQEEYDRIEKLVYSEKWAEIEEGVGILQALLEIDAIDPCDIRANCYPSSFVEKVIKWKKSEIIDSGGRCPICLASYDDASHRASIDHVIPVSRHWNTVGYRSRQAERTRFYNDTSNLMVICTSCNSSKGGEPYSKVPAYGSGFSLADAD